MDDKDREREKNGPNLKLRRVLAGGLGDSYYEMWKVPKTFDLLKFSDMVKKMPKNVHIQMVKIIDNEHSIYLFQS